MGNDKGSRKKCPPVGRSVSSPVKKYSKQNSRQIILHGQQKRKDKLQQLLDQRLGLQPQQPVASGSQDAPNSPGNTSRNASEDLFNSIALLGQHESPSASPNSLPDPDIQMDTVLCEDDDELSPLPFPSGLDPITSPTSSTRRSPKKPQKTAEERAIQFDTDWRQLLATLEDSLITYREQMYGQYPDPSVRPIYPCRTGQCQVLESSVHAYFYDHHHPILFKHCQCRSLAQILVLNGLFPTSPSRHLNAISMRLLDTYQALCQRSSDAVTALSGALGTIYRRYGHHALNKTGTLVLDPLRRALGPTLQYYDSLNTWIDKRLDSILDAIKCILPPVEIPAPSIQPTNTVAPSSDQSSNNHHHASPPSSATPTSHSTEPAHPTPGTNPTTPPATGTRTTATDTMPHTEAEATRPSQCHEYLQRACPACFGGETFRRSFDQGGDIHVALDGNLHHRHLKTGGDGQPFHQSVRFLTKEFVDAVGHRIAEARKGPKKSRTPVVPDEAVDACQNSYKAAKGNDETQRDHNFDENGVMAIVCRHDIPLFLASIDTPAEQQKHAVALIETVFSMIPANATVAGLYDVGCVLDRSLQMYDLLPTAIVERLVLATSILHSYGHQWVCQIHYNPRLRRGLGLTDGEGVERLWSRLRRLIGVERRSSRTRRIWLIDRQCDYIVTELQDDYGQWFDRRMVKNVYKKEVNATRHLERDGIPQAELRELWKQQKAAQRSRRSHAPARIRKQLAKVFELESEIDTLSATIAATRASINKMAEPSADALAILAGMEAHHREMKKKATDLYASLNLPEDHPDLAGLSMEIVTQLLLARDLKINLRTRVIGRLQECDRLDQAVGGVGEALGTRLHQHTWKNISRRTKSLENDIRKFNKYCVNLEALSQAHPDAPFVVPQQLPLQLNALRDNDTCNLWEDVWVLRGTTPPRWLVDEKVRRGIRLVHALDRSREERERLCRESQHLLRWFTTELQALEIIARDPTYMRYKSMICHRLTEHRLHVVQWSSSVAPAAKFEERVAVVKQWLDQAIPPSNPPPAATPTTSTPPLRYAANPILPPSPYSPAHDAPNPTPNMPTARLIQRLSHHAREESPVTAVYPNDTQAYYDVDSDTGSESDLEISEPQAPEALTLADVIDETGNDSDDEDEDKHVRADWSSPNDLQCDPLLWAGVQQSNRALQIKGSFSSERQFQSHVRVLFSKEALARIDKETAWLSADCVNSCSALLQHTFGGSECALITTFAMQTFLNDKRLGLGTVWRLTRGTKYWEKNVWIIPIHDPERMYWCLAIAHWERKQITIFNSFASRPAMQEWMPKIESLVLLLTTNASDQGYAIELKLSEWIARPLVVSPLQTNSYDCGVWVLWITLATLRGYDAAHINEGDIRFFRRYMSRLIRTLPTFP
ncbi:hypothetical protein PQX77_019429 [Marasmius sp. AFHP31]|nr:hypothetical protein PQX77_019429 [Marasmius sp. AFHP31]